MTTLLDRLLARLGRFAAPPPPDAYPVLPPSSLEEVLTFTLSFDGVLLATREPPDYLHFHDRELFYEIPEGRTVQLVTGGAPTCADARPDTERPIDTVNLKVSAFAGDPPLLGLLSYDEKGRVQRVEHRVREGGTVVKTALTSTALRAVLTLSGTGRMTFKTLKLACTPAPSAAGATPPAEPDPLLALVAPDYEAARRAGAEIPPPKMTSA